MWKQKASQVRRASWTNISWTGEDRLPSPVQLMFVKGIVLLAPEDASQSPTLRESLKIFLDDLIKFLRNSNSNTKASDLLDSAWTLLHKFPLSPLLSVLFRCFASFRASWPLPPSLEWLWAHSRINIDEKCNETYSDIVIISRCCNVNISLSTFQSYSIWYGAFSSLLTLLFPKDCKIWWCWKNSKVWRIQNVVDRHVWHYNIQHLWSGRCFHCLWLPPWLSMRHN